MRRWFIVAATFLAASCSPLAAFNALIPKDRAAGAPVRDIAYGRDARQKLDIYPAASPNRPVVVFFYGGSWDSGRREDYAWVGRAFAAEGFVTVVADYRLVPAVRFPAFVEDGAAAVAWTQANVEKYGGDPKNVFLVGHSAGGYIAVMLGADGRFLDNVGASKPQGVIGLAGPYDFVPFDVPASIEAFGSAPDPAQTQPVNFASADDPPFLLLHGAKDTTVREKNPRNMADALQRAGADVTYKLYPELDHIGIVLAVSRPFRGRAPVLEDAAAFIRSKAQTPS